MTLVFASHNIHKVQEVRSLLPKNHTLLSLTDIGFERPIEETADTLEGNALIKAQTVFKSHGLPCFADDTGLFISALNGAPGVLSARYAGEPPHAQRNMEKVLRLLGQSQERNAFFKTVIAFVAGDGVRYFEGRIDGAIAAYPKGSLGFGYDPIFKPSGYDQTFGEISPDIKNAISHRSQAFSSLMDHIGNL